MQSHVSSKREVERNLTQTHRREGDVKMEAEVKITRLKSRNAGHQQNWNRQGTDSPLEPLRSIADTLISTRQYTIQTFGIQNSEKINFQHYRPFMVICYNRHRKAIQGDIRNELLMMKAVKRK